MDVKVLILNIKITNKCIFTKRDLSISVYPANSGEMKDSFSQRMYAKSDSFIAADIEVNPVNNDFLSAFTLKSCQSIEGNVVIELKEGNCCKLIQIISPKGKVLSELKINANEVEEEPFFIEY